MQVVTRLLVAAFVLSSATALPAADPLFERDILPLLQRECLGCHGGLRQQGELDLRTIESMLKGGESGPAVVTRDAAASELWQKIAADEMPSGNKKLADADKQLLKQWIEAGLPTVAERLRDDDPLLDGGAKHDPLEVARVIDRHINRGLEAAGASAVPLSDDAEFLRRAYLDLNGRVPTAEQAAEFLASDDAQKRSKLIDSLLASPHFGEQLGRTWRDWIAPPELPSDPNSGKQPHNQVRDLGVWLGERIHADAKWDEIVTEIVTVEGPIKRQPHVIFHALVGEGGKPTPAGSARAIGSLFLGVQLQCAECHDDPYRTWAQDEFWALAAFFRKTNGDFEKVSESPPSDKRQREQFEMQAASIVIPPAAFLNAGKSVPAAYLKGDKFETKAAEALRPHLARWLTDKENPYFARSFANRMWFYLFSRGLVQPVDDARELNPPSHPGLMKRLANEFVASKYDIKHLVRCICNSQAYQRTSRAAPGDVEQAITLRTERFGQMPLRVMTADVLYDSLKLAYGDKQLDLRAPGTKEANTSGESAPVGDAYLEFLRRFGTNELDATDFTHGIPQLLVLINHPRLLQSSRTFDELLKQQPNVERTVEWLYLATLSRPPSEDEAREALGHIEAAADAKQATLEVLWMLVNRSEYLFVR